MTRFSYVTRILLVGKTIDDQHYVNVTLSALEKCEIVLITHAQGQEFDITSSHAIGSRDLHSAMVLNEKSVEWIDWWTDHECVFFGSTSRVVAIARREVCAATTRRVMAVMLEWARISERLLCDGIDNLRSSRICSGPKRGQQLSIAADSFRWSCI